MSTHAVQQITQKIQNCSTKKDTICVSVICVKLYQSQKQLCVTPCMPEIMWSVISSLIECETCAVCVMLILGVSFM